MEYLVWGAGRNTFKMINEYYSFHFYENPIKAVIDNDKSKWGKRILHYPIISPEKIQEYSFDKILMLSHYHTITKQIVDELQIEKEKIITKEELLEELYKQLTEEFFIFDKRVLIIGDIQNYSLKGRHYLEILNVVGFVDYHEIASIVQYSFDYVLLMNFMDIPEFSKKNVCGLTVEEKLIEQISNYGVERRKILNYGIDLILKDRDYPLHSNGKKNKDKTFLVYKPPGSGGLGAVVAVVARLAEYTKEKGYVLVVDWQSNNNQYLEDYEENRVNAWEKFFEQPEGYTLSEARNSKNVVIRCQGKRSDKLRSDLNLDFLHMKPSLEKQVDQYKKYYLEGKKVLGVLYRGSDYANRKPYAHAIQPDLSTMIETVAAKMVDWGGYDKIFLATEVREAIRAFEERFPNKVVYYPQDRVPEDYNEYLANYKFYDKNDSYRRGADYWTILNILAECDSLIAGRTGGTTVVEMLNKNRYSNKLIFDLGQYGIDDRQIIN